MPSDSRYQLLIAATPEPALVPAKGQGIDWLARSAQYDSVIHGAAKDATIQAALVRFDSNVELALAACNAGEQALERYGRHVPPDRETLAYVPSVMKVYQRLIDQAHKG